MTPLKGTSRSLIAAARPAERPTDEDRARVRARVMAKVAGAGAAAAATGLAASGASASGAVAAGAGAGVLKAIVVGAIAGICVVGAAEVARPPAPSLAPRPVESAPAVIVKSAEIGNFPPPPVEAPKPSSSAPEPRAARPEPRPPSSAGLREEVEILKEAQRAIAAGETDRAVGLLDQHESRWKGGALLEERLAARAIALCGARKGPEARLAALRFFQEAKGSPLEERVRAACAGALSGQEEK